MNRKVRNLLASVVFGVCLLALSFIPSFAANSANSASVGNVEAMKENVVYDFQSLSFLLILSYFHYLLLPLIS